MSDETPGPVDPPQTTDPELLAYGQLTEGVEDAALQDPQIRSLLSDRSKDLASIMRGESSEQVVEGRRYVHVYDPQSDQVGWLDWEQYDQSPGSYVRADEKSPVAEAIVRQTAGDVKEQLATMGGFETFAVSTATAATAGKALEWLGDDLAAARIRASRDANPNAALAGDLNAAISTSIIGGAAVGGLAAGAARAATSLGAQALPSGLLGYGAANLLSRGRQMQSFLATRAAAAGATPAMSGAAIAAGRTASTLAAEGALGEMQMAYAQAAIDQRELTSEQIWAAAGTGAVWGLGAAGVGAAMKGAYKVSAPLAKRKFKSAAGYLLNSGEAANATGKHFATKDEFRNVIRDRYKAPGRGGSVEEYGQWRSGVGQETVDENLLREMDEVGFTGRYRAADAPAGRKNQATYGESLDRMGGAVDEEVEALRRAPEPTDDLMAGLDPSKRLNTQRGQRLIDHHKIPKGEARTEFIRNTVANARRAFADQKQKIFAALDNAPAGSALAESAADIKKALEKIYPAQPRMRGARPGETVAAPKKKRSAFDLPDNPKARNLGNAYHAFDEAGETLRAVAGASTAADDISKQTASTLLDGLRRAQLGDDVAEGAFGSFGAKVRSDAAGLQAVEGVQARLFGVPGASGDAAVGLIGRGGKFDGNTWSKLIATGDGASLQDVAESINAYRSALRMYAEASPEAAKRLAPALKGLEKNADKITDQLRTRGIVDDAYRQQYRPAPKAGEVGGYTVKVKKLYDVAKDVVSGDIPTMALIALDPTIGALYGGLKKVAQSDTARSLVVSAVTNGQKRFQGAMEKASRAFDYAKLGFKPHLLGAAVTRGTGAPDPHEIDRMTPAAKAETFARVAEGIRGQMDQMDLTIAQLANATAAATSLSPELGEALQLQGARALTYLARELPEQVRDPLTGKEQPASAGQVDSFLLTYRAVEDPLVLLEDLGAGRLRTETAEAVQWVYPNLFADMAIGVSEQMQKSKEVPFTTRIQVGLMLGIPGDNLMTGPALLSFQQNYAGAQTPEQAQVMGLNERRAAQAAARMPAATRASSGRYQTISDRLEADA